jgi:hypothetical protein
LHIVVDETLQLGLDCFSPLSATHAALYGWALTPRGEPTSLRIIAGAPATARSSIAASTNARTSCRPIRRGRGERLLPRLRDAGGRAAHPRAPRRGREVVRAELGAGGIAPTCRA